MDIDRVRYFNVFAETGSLVEAAGVLHISQPALSKALKVLETEVGMRLLEADGRGLRLTEAGKRFRTESAPLLVDWLSLSKRIRDHETWKPTRIASFEVFTTYFLGYLTEFMDLEGLEILEFGPGRMEQAVSDGRAHVGITYLPVPQAGIEFLEAGRIKMGVFGLEKYKGQPFAELPFVIPLLPAQGMPSKMQGMDGWPEHKFERKVRYRVTMMETALELCRRGKAVAYLPEFVALLHNRDVLGERRLQELDAPIPRRDRLQGVYLISRRGSSETDFHRKIAKCIRSLK
jgi:DNA-binding transcriptional LysR family regulator